MITAIGNTIFKLILLRMIKNEKNGAKTTDSDIRKLAVVAVEYFRESIALRNAAVETAAMRRQGSICSFFIDLKMCFPNTAMKKREAIAERTPRQSMVGIVWRVILTSTFPIPQKIHSRSIRKELSMVVFFIFSDPFL